MDVFVVGVAASLTAALIAYFVRTWRSNLELLPAGRRARRERYDHLAGEWDFYYLTFDANVSPTPFWVRGTHTLRVRRGRYVIGLATIVDHPSGRRENKIRGEVRAGRLILADANRANDAEFACVIYPNLRNHDVIVGIWSGFDNDLRPISAPIVMSRGSLGAGALASAAAASSVRFVAPESTYAVYSRHPTLPTTAAEESPGG